MLYTVGQVIYLLSKREVKIFPAQIVEEIKRKTIESEIVSYIVKLPDKDRSEVLLEEIDADIFTSAKDLEKEMMNNAKLQIVAMLEKAQKISEIFSPKKEGVKNIKDTYSEEDIATVDLGNGQVGKVKISELQT